MKIGLLSALGDLAKSANPEDAETLELTYRTLCRQQYQINELSALIKNAMNEANILLTPGEPK